MQCVLLIVERRSLQRRVIRCGSTLCDAQRAVGNHSNRPEGVTCHRTDFGLACEAATSTFKEAFGEDALRRDPAGDWQVAATMNLPPEVSDLVAQITISHPPEWFGGRTE